MGLSGQITFADIENADCKINPKPKWLIISQRKLWCPYCNWVKSFKKDKYLGVKKCEACGITINDYYVKKYNELELFGVRAYNKNHRNGDCKY